ncbi:LAFE_0A03334g1_1 [Lachancea fermentati]|uniref:LAFE_0A03334g1_1 n=1 Tax=Lachancea fermentati TaxID=4955 RepID=A0A1G4M6R8_LACFM|nr:LAFE_0A03334g1_1 [Lachancea fermentati]
MLLGSIPRVSHGRERRPQSRPAHGRGCTDVTRDGPEIRGVWAHCLPAREAALGASPPRGRLPSGCPSSGALLRCLAPRNPGAAQNFLGSPSWCVCLTPKNSRPPPVASTASPHPVSAAACSTKTSKKPAYSPATLGPYRGTEKNAVLKF